MRGPADFETLKSEARLGATQAGAGRAQVKGRVQAAKSGECAERN